MHYEMRTPCPECPFLKQNNFSWRSLKAHASGEFACHKKCNRKDGHYAPREGKTSSGRAKTPHCAGALIFLEKQEKPHQMMRICERLGLYDRSKLNMDANVGSKPSDYRKADAFERMSFPAFDDGDDEEYDDEDGEDEDCAIEFEPEDDEA